MLNKLQQRPDIKVQITYLDYADTREVDAKLIKAAREIDAVVDFAVQSTGSVF